MACIWSRAVTERASGSTPTCTARRNWSMPPRERCRSPRRRDAGWCRPTARLIRLAVLELHHAEDSTTFIPLPHEPRCRRAADIVLADPTASHEIEALARAVGTSARTLSRLFSSETQLSFKSWCQRARIAAAIERLSM